MDTSGLTSGVDYFGSVGQRRNVLLNRGPQTIASAETEVPPGTGFVSSGGESGFEPSMGGGGGQRVSQEQAFNMGMTGAGLGLLGAATNTPEFGMVGGFLGSSAAASQGNFAPIVGQTAGMISKNADVANLANLATQAYQSYSNRAVPETTELDPEGQYLGSTGSIQNANRDASLLSSLGSTVAGQAIPGYNIANLALLGATGFFGDTPTSIGDIASFAPMGYQNFVAVDPVDAAQGQKAIQYAQDPVAVAAALRGVNMPENPLAMEDARRASAWANNTGWGESRPAELQAQFDAGQQRVGGLGLDVDSIGLSTPDSDNMGPGAPGSVGRDAFEASGGGGGGDSGGGGNAAGSDGFSGMSNQGEGGFGSVGGWKDGGMIGDMPGITQRYMDGGPVQGGPMLSMGYAEGGMMGQISGQPTPAVVNRQVDAMLRDPRARQSLLARPQQLMASGELTPDEVTTMGRVAEAALFSPELYPQLRQFVVAQGMTPLPAAFDPSVIMRVMAISRGLQQATPAGQVPGTDQAQMQRPVPGDGNGGYLQGPGTGRSDSIGTVNETTGEPVKVANGEYVIPAHIVRAKGREFFDNLLRRYSDVPKGE
jgi:hypothetical protein